MLQTATLNFLKELKKNNNKPWFDTNRKKYETAKADMALLVQSIINSVAIFDEPIGLLEPKNCTFRINRDVRFSKDKSPYKNNMGASFNAGGKKVNNAGYYFHCEPGNCFAAGGFYMPSPIELNKIRQEIDYNLDVWLKIIGNKTFKKYFPKGVDGIENLSRPPRGYDEQNPAIKFLKMKGFIVSSPFSDNDILAKNAVKEITATFRAIKPMVDFLNNAVA
jgi:uncharacterized protein (TIGR02453 family)